MALNLEQKKAVVVEVADIAVSSVSAIAANYRGLTVAEMNELREKARNSGINIRIVRNTLAKRALQGTEFACMDEVLVGPLVLMFSKTEPGAVAKLAHEFMKTHGKLEVKAIVLGGQLLSASELEKIAQLPSRDDAIAALMSVMKAPISKFVRTIAEPHAKLVRTVAAVRDKKEAA